MMTSRWLMAAMGLTLLAGCTEILRAEFDLGSNESLVSGPLPGPPPGDSVVVTGEVVAAGSGVSMLLGAGPPTPRLDFITGGKPHDTTAYAISFEGVKLTITDTPVLAIDTIDVAGRNACRLEISGGEFRLVGGDGPKVIGEYTAAADVHHVLLRLDKFGSRCAIQITQVAQGEPDSEPTVPTIIDNVPFQDPDFDELDIVRFAWEQVEPDDATQYFLDTLVVSKQRG